MPETTKTAKDQTYRLLEDSPDLYETPQDTHPFQKGIPWHVKALSTTVLVLLLYISILVTRNHLVVVRSCHAAEDADMKTLTTGALKYQTRPAWPDMTYPWNLEPSEELDAAWDNLMLAQNIRVTAQEMTRMGENTTNRARVENGDYVGVLGVWHHLHCLDHLRRMIHYDYYAANVTGKEAALYLTEHSDHCVETLRVALMCRADVALYSAEWVRSSHEPENKAIRSDANEKCVDWESLEKWALARALDPRGTRYLPGPYEHQG
ncbi:hypothetical protein BCR34DRAFT_636609 [Clohesyomyces aquaticus]|uniref:Tat pathway signal sequence n=1 Tax=Clohesyomyces aquaticus TaxID=1231657 RepID=A0A1Y1YVW4_9PLEO|nr:hypothetical protein BCR34DRAFT_636609 [Clohesyomyces aquaticus]